MFDQVETGMKVRIEVQNNWSDKREIERKVIFTDDLPCECCSSGIASY